MHPPLHSQLWASPSGLICVEAASTTVRNLLIHSKPVQKEGDCSPLKEIQPKWVIVGLCQKGRPQASCCVVILHNLLYSQPHGKACWTT